MGVRGCVYSDVCGCGHDVGDSGSGSVACDRWLRDTVTVHLPCCDLHWGQEEDGSSTTAFTSAIPRSRLPVLVKLAADRLKDKSSLVRKDVCCSVCFVCRRPLRHTHCIVCPSVLYSIAM